jgi:hypothetical protein
MRASERAASIASRSVVSIEPELAKIVKVENRKATASENTGEAMVLGHDEGLGRQLSYGRVRNTERKKLSPL